MATKPGALKVQKSEEALRLSPRGDLVASTVESLRSGMLKAIDGAQGPVVLDLGTARQIDSLGITLTLGLFKSCQKKGIGFSVEGVSPDILRVFRLFNLTRFFPIEEAAK
ncbi:MAG: STAS domain-containing protein [Acidobacteria bacterium]|nr:STAS domain-containing protein [Acidobacteriota bacterium]